MKKRAIVVGAGLGGLAAAIRLQQSGIDVTVLERLPQPGGRCHNIYLEGFHFDTGPTMLMMIEELERLFEDCGRNLADYIRLKKLNPHSRFHFPDGETITMGSDLLPLAAEFDRIEPGAGRKLTQWLEESKALYDVGMSQFIDRSKPNFLSALDPQNLSMLLKGQVTDPLYECLDRTFSSKRIQDILAFSSLYLGINPFSAPSIYSLLAYAEIDKGLFFPEGGMTKIAQALSRLAREIGVKIDCGKEVLGLEVASTGFPKTVRAIKLKDETISDTEVVVVNADLPDAYERLLGTEHPRAGGFTYTCGALLIFLGLKSTHPDLIHHQVFFPDNYRDSMNTLFEEMKIPDDPVFYLCSPTTTDPTLAPPGCQAISILIPVPSEGKEIDWSLRGPRLKALVLERIKRNGINIKEEDIQVERMLSPEEMGDRFRLKKNAAFGLSHRLLQMGPLRPSNKHHLYENLYFTGASTHPGGGIPMVLKSGRLTAERIITDRGYGRQK